MKRRMSRIQFSQSELVNIRRFLNRGIECAEGHCRGRLSVAWYCLRPILEKVQRAIDRARKH